MSLNGPQNILPKKLPNICTLMVPCAIKADMHKSLANNGKAGMHKLTTEVEMILANSRTGSGVFSIKFAFKLRRLILVAALCNDNYI
jgi:hypothetical protein